MADSTRGASLAILVGFVLGACTLAGRGLGGNDTTDGVSGADRPEATVQDDVGNGWDRGSDTTGGGGGGNTPAPLPTRTPSPTPTPTTTPGPREVVLLTHDSFAVPQDVLNQFEVETGYRVKVLRSGDAGQLANKVVLTKGSPIGDAVYGIDNTFASRVTSSGALVRSEGILPASATRYSLPSMEMALQLNPIDYAHTCVNIDTTWFASHKVNPPRTLDDLLKPEYRNLVAVPGAATSSPGMSMLVATVGKYGESGWADYWRKLVANGARISNGWEQAYNVDFTQGQGKGDRPIVWSYDTSPAFTVKNGTSTTAALLDTCTRQVEYAGVLKGAKNPEGAQELVSWMMRRQFQQALPTSMYVFPVDDTVALPADWTRYAKQPKNVITVDPATIDARREAWLTQWQDVASR